MAQIRTDTLFLILILAAPVSLLGLVVEPLVIATLLTPPRGEQLPAQITSPRSQQDFIDRANYFIKNSRKYKDATIRALEAAETAVRLDPTNGDALMCRAYVHAARREKEAAVADALRARDMYKAAGNMKEVYHVTSLYLPQLRQISEIRDDARNVVNRVSVD